MPEPLTPSPGLISEYLGKWQQLENYRLQEASLGLLFHSLCPANKKIEHVLLKVSCLNDFYSTNIFDIYSVAKHILNKDVDARLEAVDYSLVNDIARISIKEKPKNFYSFASKYCSHHKPDSYPIFDSFVEKMMLYDRSADAFNGFEKGDLQGLQTLCRNHQELSDLLQVGEALTQRNRHLFVVGRQRLVPQKVLMRRCDLARKSHSEHQAAHSTRNQPASRAHRIQRQWK